MILLGLILIALLIRTVVRKKRYEHSEYYAQTKKPYFALLGDKGALGEYYTYHYLKNLNGYKRFLFNCYLPKDNGETTELDVIMIHESGIYVFESKNYSGWIFGTETQQYWTQTMPAGGQKPQKNRFFNPIMQNKVHLKWLQSYLKIDLALFYSYIVFSERCTLKNIKLTSKQHHVINRYDVLSEVQCNATSAGKCLSDEEVELLYEKLYPLTQVDTLQKLKHIHVVQEKQKNRTKQNPLMKLEG